MALQASSFAFHVTYTCPLTCAHCCFNSSPTVKDKLDPQRIAQTIDALPDSIDMVAFTGGEPFLHGAHLVDYVRLAAARQFRTRIVTSAYFATTSANADRRLQPLKTAGLDELSISWDDYHEKFVSFDCVRNLCLSAVQLGISVAVSSVQSSRSQWTAERIRQALGELQQQVQIVCESDLNLTGRAEQELAEEGFRGNGYLGPCPYVLTGPTLSAKGNLLACCGVIPNSARLVISDTAQPETVRDDIEASLSNPLLLWLHLRGPFNLLQEASHQKGLPVIPADEIGGNCQACRHLFEADAEHELIDSFLAIRGESIRHEALLLETLGLLSAGKLVDLWASSSHTRLDVS